VVASSASRTLFVTMHLLHFESDSVFDFLQMFNLLFLLWRCDTRDFLLVYPSDLVMEPSKRLISVTSLTAGGITLNAD